LAGPAVGEELAPLARQPLPLAIRDGRIARLTVHAVPFDVGSKDLAPATAAALGELVAGLATDCFLTAEAIGHVRPGTPGDGDTLASHRLARARAEAVQAALTEGGLPAESVASVWDFQFTVRASHG
jgi:outer membrane protein OmpA-like peptidoglycan-associated protein